MCKKYAASLLALAGLSAGLWLAPLVAAPLPPPAADHSALIAELTKQQAQLIANQDKIDTTLAAVKEEIRLARLFSARSGGKTTTP